LKNPKTFVIELLERDKQEREKENIFHHWGHLSSENQYR